MPSLPPIPSDLPSMRAMAADIRERLVKRRTELPDGVQDRVVAGVRELVDGLLTTGIETLGREALAEWIGRALGLGFAMQGRWEEVSRRASDELAASRSTRQRSHLSVVPRDGGEVLRRTPSPDGKPAQVVEVLLGSPAGGETTVRTLFPLTVHTLAAGDAILRAVAATMPSEDGLHWEAGIKHPYRVRWSDGGGATGQIALRRSHQDPAQHPSILGADLVAHGACRARNCVVGLVRGEDADTVARVREVVEEAQLTVGGPTGEGSGRVVGGGRRVVEPLDEDGFRRALQHTGVVGYDGHLYGMAPGPNDKTLLTVSRAQPDPPHGLKPVGESTVLTLSRAIDAVDMAVRLAFKRQQGWDPEKSHSARSAAVDLKDRLSKVATGWVLYIKSGSGRGGKEGTVVVAHPSTPVQFALDLDNQQVVMTSSSGDTRSWEDGHAWGFKVAAIEQFLRENPIPVASGRRGGAPPPHDAPAPLPTPAASSLTSYASEADKRAKAATRPSDPFYLRGIVVRHFPTGGTKRYVVASTGDHGQLGLVALDGAAVQTTVLVTEVYADPDQTAVFKGPAQAKLARLWESSARTALRHGPASRGDIVALDETQRTTIERLRREATATAAPPPSGETKRSRGGASGRGRTSGAPSSPKVSEPAVRALLTKMGVPVWTRQDPYTPGWTARWWRGKLVVDWYDNYFYGDDSDRHGGGPEPEGQRGHILRELKKAGYNVVEILDDNTTASPPPVTLVITPSEQVAGAAASSLPPLDEGRVHAMLQQAGAQIRPSMTTAERAASPHRQLEDGPGWWIYALRDGAVKLAWYNGAGTSWRGRREQAEVEAGRIAEAFTRAGYTALHEVHDSIGDPQVYAAIPVDSGDLRTEFRDRGAFRRYVQGWSGPESLDAAVKAKAAGNKPLMSMHLAEVLRVY